MYTKIVYIFYKLKKMNLYLWLFSLLSSPAFFSFSPLFLVECYKPKFCMNCKYFLRDNILPDDLTFAHCAKFPKKDENEMEYLITGEKNKEVESFHFCTTARRYDDKCGKEGKHYRRKSNKEEDV